MSSWKIGLTKEVIKEAKKYNFYERLISRLTELQEALKRETEKVLELLHADPVIFEVGQVKVRRMRIGDYRLLLCGLR